MSAELGEAEVALTKRRRGFEVGFCIRVLDRGSDAPATRARRYAP